jgi:tRNA(Ile)-lysidine synthase
MMRRHGMARSGDHVLVAVSGGADSVALLHCLCALAGSLGLRLTAAHLNHELRGEESARDERFVRTLCASMGVPLVCESIDVAGRAASRKQNLEEAARRIRYGFLRRAAAEAGAARIAVGHTLDDQAESVLLRLLRGSGARGLAGIHPVLGGDVIRPLLEISRAEILAYLDALGLDHREDSTNTCLSNRRNRIRHELLPYLRENFNPGILEALARSAGLAREAAGFLEAHSRELYASLREPRPDGFAISCDSLVRFHPAVQKQILFHAIRESRGSVRGVSAAHIASLLGLAGGGRSGRSVRLPGGVCIARQFQHLLFSAVANGSGSAFSYELALPGECTVPEAGLRFKAWIIDGREVRIEPQRPVNKAFILLEPLPSAFTVRSRVPGDRYGGAGHRKVKKVLIDARIPIGARSSLAMVVSGRSVVWIPGFPPPKSLNPRPSSGRCVVLEVERIPPTP